MYRYQNENNDEIVEFDEVNEDLEQRPNWHRLGQEDIEVDTGDDDALSIGEVVTLVCENLAEFDDSQINRLDSAISAETAKRAGTGSEAAEANSGDSKTDADTEQIDVTDAAKELAETEGIDLSTVSGTGESGRITIGDVRKAAEANSGD
jgi:pyruvate/2-oxoglutarate dehydrogenase complex dihydrolipoamide acyltransferase (E2) component